MIYWKCINFWQPWVL